ncbi:hypothetical protein CRG98_002219 [Punica granatum]|uniref:Uncharacterized protein n=1 Tax=Punica granatum TaxID=22663 RepID=A0A2I0L9M5_PUNGR|nr:hypothetical protein CRG98_002219 [Punica granatum]
MGSCLTHYSAPSSVYVKDDSDRVFIIRTPVSEQKVRAFHRIYSVNTGKECATQFARGDSFSRVSITRPHGKVDTPKPCA